MRRLMVWAVALGLSASAGLPGVVRAEEPELGWSDEAELSFVLVDGNSESESLGFRNVLRYRWEEALFRLRAGGIKVESTTTTFTAPAPGTVIETSSTETNAENYHVNARYNREVTERFFWYVGAGWDRNEFAGIDNRYIAEAGVGNVWLDREDVRFETSYALTYTDQEDVVEDPLIDDTYVGARFSWDYQNKITPTTSYANLLVLDLNADETDDWRGDMVNALAVTMTDALALKVSLQWLYDNNPAIMLVGPVDPPERVELDELDTIFTTSLVVTF